MKPVFLIGKLASPKWVKPAVEANLSLGNAKGSGNASLRRQGIEVAERRPAGIGMTRSEFFRWFSR